MLFIAVMGLLLKFTDFAAVLLLAAVITGLLWLYDARFARPRRGEMQAEPIVVDMARAFFPVIVVVFLIRSFWVEPFKIPSGSMNATLLVGDFILVNKYTYGIRIPVINKKVIDVNPIARGDVVVFRYPADPSVDYIKRVVGLPGDKIVYRGKRLYREQPGRRHPAGGLLHRLRIELPSLPMSTEVLGNHKHQLMIVPAQPPVDHAAVRQFPHRENCEYNDDGFSCTVPPDNYFMMGDNRTRAATAATGGSCPTTTSRGARSWCG